MSRPAAMLHSVPKSLLVLVGLLLLFVAVGVFAPLLAPYSPFDASLIARLRPPNSSAGGKLYLLGTDELGRDLLSRIIHGFRVSLTVAALSVTISGTLGVLIGVVAAIAKGPVEIVLMRAADITLSVPTILLAIIVIAILGPGFANVILVLVLTRWPRYARLAYSQTLQISSLAYVRYSRALGSSRLYTIGRHILPNIANPLIVLATLEFGLMILYEAGLSFLGLGVQPPNPTWGGILASGRNYVTTAWWIAVFPGLCLFSVVLLVNVLGDRLSDHLDPRR